MTNSLLARLSILGLAVIATVATPATEPLAIIGSSTNTIELAADARVAERLVRVTVNNAVLNAEGGFLASLRMRACLTEQEGTLACVDSDVEAAPVSLLVDGAAQGVIPDTIGLELAGFADDLFEERIVTLLLDEGTERASIRLEADALVTFPGLDTGSILETGDSLPPGANVTVEIIEVEPVDGDADGLSDGEERVLGTDPAVADTDGDGLNDGAEIAARADPNVQDTDADGLLDGAEVERGTNADDDDSDDDGDSDGAEVACGTSPLDPFFVCADHDEDGDGVSDLDEAKRGTDPNDVDSDDDGRGDGAEIARGTDPLDADSDDDTIGDGVEEEQGTNPLAADSDEDGLDDAAEAARGTNPIDADTDDDGDDDGVEVACDSSPLDAAFTCAAP